MRSIKSVNGVVAAALLSLAASACAQDAYDELIAELTPAQQEALLRGVSERDIRLDDDSTLADRLGAMALQSWSPVYTLSATGSSQTLPTSGANNATWTLNGPNATTGGLTEVHARIVHDGFLTTASGTTGWDHLAIVTRGLSLESALQYLGFPGNAASPFFYGEWLAGASQATLDSATRGRGPTFWAKGHPFCMPVTSQHPCMLIENYSELPNGVYGVITEAPVALPISAGPFDVIVRTTSSNVEASVSQGGQVVASIDCRQVRPNDLRCGAQPVDGPVVDVGFSFIMGNIPAAHAGRQVGVLAPAVTLYRLRTPPHCPGCPIP